MASDDNAVEREIPVGETESTRVFSLRMILLVWAPIVAIGLLHYLTPSEEHGFHNILRRLYYLPIVIAAFQAGLVGALSASLVVSITYVPHAFLLTGHLAHSDPALPLEKALEIGLYNVVGGVAGYLADAERTRRRELQKALEEQRSLQDQLVRAGRLSALGEVVAGIAHEVKNPLHALKGTAEIVAAAIPAASPERRMWELHRSELDRLESVADRFLSFARPVVTDAVHLDLRDVVARVGEIVDADARKRGIELDVLLPDAPLPVVADRDQLAQVVLNIAVNAIQAIGERGGRITLSAASGEGQSSRQSCVVIENDGPKLDEQAIENMFDPFWSRSRNGTGLGLSISERIVEGYGGRIEASNDGLGVRFAVCLPASEVE